MPADKIGNSRFSLVDYGHSMKLPGDSGVSSYLIKNSPVGMDFTKTGKFSILFKIKFAVDESRANKIWRKDVSTTKGYTLIFEKSGSNHVFDFQESTGFSNDQFVLPSDFFVDRWHHGCLTVDGASESSVTTRFYWDGIRVTTKNTNINWTAAVADLTSAIRIGDEASATCPNAYMDEVQYYDRVLQHYEERECMFKNRPILDSAQVNGYDSHLKGYWKMDEATGLLVADTSLTGNDMTLVGGVAFSTNVFM